MLQPTTPILHRDPTLEIVPEHFRPEMPFEIYGGMPNSQIPFHPVTKKTDGAAIGTIYELGETHKRWLGKVGNPSPYLPDDSSPKQIIKQMNLDAIFEKIAADFYGLFQNKYKTPLTCLSNQKFLDEFTSENEYAVAIAETIPADRTLRFMSKLVKGYQNLAAATTVLNDVCVPIEKFIIQCHRPPEEIFSPNGELVPLKGLIELCAAMRILADIDGLGGSLANAGFVWERENDKIISARVVKVDPGFSFQFALFNGIESPNKALSTIKKAGYSSSWLSDLRDIQTASSNQEITFHWKALTERQQREFLDALNKIMKISKEDLFYGFYREGAFDLKETAHIPEKIAHLLVDQMCEWIELQKKIYNEELTLRKAAFHYPPPLASFVGRENILTSLAQKLIPTTDHLNLAVLCGMGGLGKSELASHFAFKEREAFSLIYWLQGDNEINLLNSYLALAEFLHLSLQDTSSLDTVRTQIHHALENRKEWLLIFDNVENNIPLPKKGGSVLITSREQNLWPYDDIIEVPRFTNEEAIKYTSSLIHEDVDSILKLVKRLDGIPLAISHAAASIKEQNLTIEDYLTRMSFSNDKPLLDIWKAMFSKIEQENCQTFEWLVICSFLHPENISIDWLKDWLMNDKGLSIDAASINATKIMAHLKKYHLIQFDRQHGTFSIHRLLHDALCTYQQKALYKKVLIFLERNGKKFEKKKLETLEQERQWYVHADWFLAQENKEDSALHAQVFNLMGTVARHLNMFRKARKWHQKALETWQRIHEGNAHPDIANSLNNLGKSLRNLGRNREALSAAEKALEMSYRIYGDQPHLDIANSFNNIGKSLRRLDQYEKALENHQKAMEVLHKIHGEKPSTDIASTLCNMGRVLRGYHLFEDALDVDTQAMEMRVKIYGEVHPSIANSLQRINFDLQKLNRFEKALDVNLKALKIQREIHGRSHSEIAAALNWVGISLWALNRTEEALDFVKQALEMRYEIYREKADSDIVVSLSLVGAFSSHLDRNEEALDAHKKALEMRDMIHGKKEHPDRANLLESIGRNLKRLERFDEAIDAHNKAMVIRYKIYGDHAHHKIADSLYSIGKSLRLLGKFKESLDSFKEALKILNEIHHDKAHPKIAKILYQMGFPLISLGLFEEALNVYNTALEMRDKIHEKKAHPDIALLLTGKGLSLNLLNRFEEADAAFQQALKMKIEIHGKISRLDIADLLDMMGNNLGFLNRFNERFNAYKTALEMRYEIYGELAHPNIAVSLLNMANILCDFNLFEEGLDTFQKALQTMYRIHGEKADHPDIADTLYKMGLLSIKLGLFKEALGHHKKALKMRYVIYGEIPHLKIAESLKQLGLTFSHLGQKTLALKNFQQALKILENLYENNPNIRIKNQITFIQQRIEKDKTKCLMQ